MRREAKNWKAVCMRALIAQALIALHVAPAAKTSFRKPSFTGLLYIKGGVL